MKVHKVWRIRAVYDAIDWQDSLIDAYSGVKSPEATRMRRQCQTAIEKYKLILEELGHKHKRFLIDGEAIPLTEIKAMTHPTKGKGEK